MKKLFALLVLFTLVATLSGCAAPLTQEELASADYGKYPSDYENIIKSYMDIRLKDPDSARYQFLNTPQTGWNRLGGKKFGYIVCVYINAKNSFGGYVGNRINYFMINNGNVIDALHGDGNYGDAIVQGACKNFINK